MQSNLITRAKPSTNHWLALLLMVACFMVATIVTPKSTWFEHLGQPAFESITPANFGDWAIDVSASNSGVVDPQVQDKVASIYTQIVSRVYVHKPTGRRVMLSIAYGDRQTFGNQLHRPEACYSSQGFNIQNISEVNTPILGTQLPLSRMHVNLGNRQEFVTYFIRVGDRILSGPPTALNKARLNMGLSGYVADGLLFRVSEITLDEKSTYRLQENFISQMLRAVAPEKLNAFTPQALAPI